MRIGEVADAVGVAPETVRYYERRGLLPAPKRATNGYRVYDDAALFRLRFIRDAQAAGLTLAEIHSIIELRDEGTVPCEHVEALLAAKLVAIQEQQRQLERLAVEVRQLVERSQSLDPADCGPYDVCRILSREHPRIVTTSAVAGSGQRS